MLVGISKQNPGLLIQLQFVEKDSSLKILNTLEFETSVGLPFDYNWHFENHLEPVYKEMIYFLQFYKAAKSTLSSIFHVPFDDAVLNYEPTFHDNSYSLHDKVFQDVFNTTTKIVPILMDETTLHRNNPES